MAAQSDSTFGQWIADFYPMAAKEGIKLATYEHAFAGVDEPDPDVQRKARYQPEFTTEVWDYLDPRVNERTAAMGKKMAVVHKATLDAVEKRFGVEREVVLAIWSMETAYGKILSQPERLHYIPRALATLAWGDKRRARFARQQLIGALQILQAGDIHKDQLIGSWAGAMGHTQFIPTSYLAYAVDMDGDGRRDIWNSVPDALGTAANLLRQNGWRTGKSWGYEILANPKAVHHDGNTYTLEEWQAKGMRRPDNTPFPNLEEKAELKFPAGKEGPPFLIQRNFFVLKRYNNSDFYALAVGQLANRIGDHGVMRQNWPRPEDSLDSKEKFLLQQLLKDFGHYEGEIDGNIGPATRKAIRLFQSEHKMDVNGRPTKILLLQLQQRIPNETE
jgi:membrane-bound lytic murein transglycosylase B